jgi:hypothetical protein
VAWRITNLPEKMSAIVKEYSCTPMEPIRIQRRLVQSSSLPLYLSLSLSLSFSSSPASLSMVDRMLEERREMVGWLVKQHSVHSTLPPPLW